jgi:hypothetical protein
MIPYFDQIEMNQQNHQYSAQPDINNQQQNKINGTKDNNHEEQQQIQSSSVMVT